MKKICFLFIIFLICSCSKKVEKEGLKQAGKLSEMRLYIQFEKIENLWRKGKFDEAISFCKKYLKENPKAQDCDKAQFALAYLYYDFMNTNNDYNKAIEEFNKVLTNYPNTSLKDKTLYWIGICYHNLGKFEQAISAYEKLIKYYPDSDFTYGSGYVWSGAVFHIAHIYETEYLDYEQALLIYKQIIENANGIDWKDRAIERMNIILRAIEFKVVKHYPLIGYKEGERLWRLGNFENLIKECNKVKVENKNIEDEIEFTLAYVNFDYRNKERNIDKAKTVFSQFLKKYPNSSLASDAQYWLGVINLEKGDFKEAISEFQKVAKNFPDSFLVDRSYLRIGRIYQKELNDLKLADSFYQKILISSSDKSLLKTVKIYINH